MTPRHKSLMIGSRLVAIDRDLWAVEAPFRVAGVELGTRMSVIRRPDGGLLLYSPVAFEPALGAELRALGPLAHVVAPSKVHHLFAGGWAEAHPEAKLWGAPGLPAKRPDLGFFAELPGPVDAWAPELLPALIEGAPYMNEVVLLHRPSRSLLVTDIAFNIHQSDRWWTRRYLQSMGAYGGFAQSRMVKWCVRDRPAVRRSIDRVLGWDFDRVVVTHGAILESGGKQALAEVFAWL